MPRVLSSYDSIRQTLDYGQFDVCESLLRDLLENPEVEGEDRDLLKRILASVVVRRALDHSRNFVARGNLDSARRVLHKTWHQLDNEGLADFAEASRAGIARAASDSELDGFSADHVGEIIAKFVGAAHFEELVEELPQNERSTNKLPADRATRMVTGKERSPLQNTKQSVVVIDSTQASIGQLILRSMLRPRVMIAALLTFMIVMALGMTTRTTSWQTRFSLLRPTNTGDEAYEVKVTALPKQTLQSLATWDEVLDPTAAKLRELVSDDLLREQLTSRHLKEMITASVASSDYGQSPLTLQLSFTGATEEITKAGGQILMDQIILVHNEIVNRDLRFTIEQKRRDLQKLESDLEKLNEDLRVASVGLTVPAGDQRQRIDTLLKMFVEARKGYDEASVAAASAEVRSSEIVGSLEGLDPSESWKTTQQASVSSLVLQPLYLQLSADKQRQERLERQISAGNLGAKHMVVLELESLKKSITSQEAYIEEQKALVSEAGQETVMERANPTFNAVDIEAHLARADRVARSKAKEEWAKAVKSIEAELATMSGESKVPGLLEDIGEKSSRKTDMQWKMRDLEIFAERNPGGLQPVSMASAPEIAKSSAMKIGLAALGLALLMAIIVSFTGGHRAVHVVVLGLLATLFYVR